MSDTEALARLRERVFVALDNCYDATCLCWDDDDRRNCPHANAALIEYVGLENAIARRDEHDPFNCGCCPRKGNRYDAAVEAAKAEAKIND